MAESHEFISQATRQNAVMQLEMLLANNGGVFENRSASDIEVFCYQKAMKAPAYSSLDEYDKQVRDAYKTISERLRQSQQLGNFPVNNLPQHQAPNSKNPISALHTLITHTGQPPQGGQSQSVVLVRPPGGAIAPRGMVRPSGQQQPNIAGGQAGMMAQQPTALQVVLNDPSSPLSVQQASARSHQYQPSSIPNSGYQGIMPQGPLGPGGMPPHTGTQRAPGPPMHMMQPGMQPAQSGPGQMVSMGQPNMNPAEMNAQQAEEQRAIREKLASMQRFVQPLRNWLMQQEAGSIVPTNANMPQQVRIYIDILEGRQPTNLSHLQRIDDLLMRKFSPPGQNMQRPQQPQPQQTLQQSQPPNPANFNMQVGPARRLPPPGSAMGHNYPPGTMLPNTVMNQPSPMPANLPVSMGQNVPPNAPLQPPQSRLQPRPTQPFPDNPENVRFVGPAGSLNQAYPTYSQQVMSQIRPHVPQHPSMQPGSVEQQPSPSPSAASVNSSSTQQKERSAAAAEPDRRRPEAPQGSPANQAASGQQPSTLPAAANPQVSAGQPPTEPAPSSAPKPPPDVPAHEFYADQLLRSVMTSPSNRPLLESANIKLFACRKRSRSFFDEMVLGDRLFSEFDFGAAPSRVPPTDTFAELIDRRVARMLKETSTSGSASANRDELTVKRRRTKRDIALRNELSRLTAWCTVEFDSDWPALSGTADGQAAICDAEKYADLHCTCSLIELPAVSLRVSIPTDYPEMSPSVDSDADGFAVNGEPNAPFKDEHVAEMKRSFSTRVSVLPSRYSLTALLSVWRTCVSLGAEK